MNGVWARRTWWAGLAFIVATAIFNIGVIAIDDYTFAVGSIIPAQIRTPQTVIDGSGFRSAFPSLTLLPLTELALGLGIENPANQLRLVLIVVGIFSFLMNAGWGRRFFRLEIFEDDRRELIVVFLMGFFFLSPLFSTRPMIESLAAPFLTASAYFAARYVKFGTSRSMLAALLLVTIAALFRLQAGVCALALAFVVARQKRWTDLGLLALAGGLLFVVTGFLDWAVKGSFHASLKGYVSYNLEHSSSFGVTPFYTFILLFIGISIPPVFFSRYRSLHWRREYRPLMPALAYFLVFVAVHSVIPHKEERFMIPIIPIFLVLLTPLANHLMSAPAPRWRLRFFMAINGLLLLACSFNVPQNNILGLADYLQRHPSIQMVANAPGTIVLFPDVFIARKVESRDVLPGDLAAVKGGNCGIVFAARKDLVDKLPGAPGELKKIAEFKPGWLEALAVALNPRQNARRGPIELYTVETCQL